MANSILRIPATDLARYEYEGAVFFASIPPEDGPSRTIYDQLIADGVVVEDLPAAGELPAREGSA